MAMTNEEFEALVTLMNRIAYRATGEATHQPRAGSEGADIEEARSVLVDDDQ